MTDSSKASSPVMVKPSDQLMAGKQPSSSSRTIGRILQSDIEDEVNFGQMLLVVM